MRPCHGMTSCSHPSGCPQHKRLRALLILPDAPQANLVARFLHLALDRLHTDGSPQTAVPS